MSAEGYFHAFEWVAPTTGPGYLQTIEVAVADV